MSASRKPNRLKAFRKALGESTRRFALSAVWKDRLRRMQRSRKENAKKAAALSEAVSSVLDQPATWLEHRRRAKQRQAARKQAALDNPPPSMSFPDRLSQAVREWVARSTKDRTKLWRRTAGALGALAVFSLVGNLLMYYRFTPARPLVTIGRRVVHLQEYHEDLEMAAGQAVLSKIVFTELIRQAAAKAGVTPTAAQIDARLAEMQRQGTPDLETADPAQLRENVALALALENLRLRGVSASDAEIAAFYQKNAAQMAQPAQVQSILVVTQSEFDSQTATSLLAHGKSASEIAEQPDMHVDGEKGYHVNLTGLPEPLHRTIVGAAMAMHPGQIATLSVGKAFLTMKCLRKSPQTQPLLPQVRDQVARLVKLQKAPSAQAEMALLYKANPPDFDMDRYAAYFSGVNDAAGAARTASVP